MKLHHLAVLAILALPAASALPGLCGSECRIGASLLPGYDPIVAHLASGSTVTWHSTDISHVTRDDGVLDTCFQVVHRGDEDSPGVRFDVVGEMLTATVDGVMTLCGNALGNGDAGVVLPYYCVLHPTMRGALVVTK